MEPITIIIIVIWVALALILCTIAILVLRNPRATLAGLFRVLVWVAVIAVCFVPFSFIPLFWLIFAFVVIDIVQRYRASQQYALLWLLTVSAEHLMPLAPAVAAFARERGGFFGHRAWELAELLNAGETLPDALERVGGLLPRHALPMVRVGAEAGALAPALRQAATSYDLQGPIWLNLLGKIIYVTLVPAFGSFILMFVMLKIVPAFRKIFEDFGTTLPPMTRTLIGASNFVVNYWYLFPLPLLLGLLVFYTLMRYWGWTDWDLPGVAGLVRRFDSAQILDSLALVARQQRPLGDGITALARSYPKYEIRRRLGQTDADILTGGDWCESLHRRGLIQAADRAVLQAAQRVGNLPWALEEMADSSRRRLAYRVQAIIQAAFPVVVILVGLAVMFVVVALFLPLIALIQHLVV